MARCRRKNTRSSTGSWPERLKNLIAGQRGPVAHGGGEKPHSTTASVTKAYCVQLDPHGSLPGLTRQSIIFEKSPSRRGWTRGSSPRVTHTVTLRRIKAIGIVTRAEKHLTIGVSSRAPRRRFRRSSVVG